MIYPSLFSKIVLRSYDSENAKFIRRTLAVAAGFFLLFSRRLEGGFGQLFSKIIFEMAQNITFCAKRQFLRTTPETVSII